jgi:hypothetical protein
MGMVLKVDRELRQRGWSVYADPQPNWLGQPATRLFRTVSSEECLGVVDTVTDRNGTLTDGSYLQGWAWDRAGRQGPLWIVVIDANGTVRGLGRGGLPRKDVMTVHAIVSDAGTGWRAYTTERPPLAGAEVFAVLADGQSICRLPKPN